MFMEYKLETPEKRGAAHLRPAKDAREATGIISREYERPANDQPSARYWVGPPCGSERAPSYRERERLLRPCQENLNKANASKMESTV
jgi:hypothetical protein